MSENMNINQVEKITGVSKRNIRFYEKEGLILPKRNSENSYRVYDEYDIWRIKVIKMLRMLDMPLEEIKKVLEKAENEASSKAIDIAFINKYIDKIYITPVDDETADISVKIFTGETVEKQLRKIRGRTGHMFKKMIESYENGMK